LKASRASAAICGRDRHRVLLRVGQHAGQRAGQDGFFASCLRVGGIKFEFDQQHGARFDLVTGLGVHGA
jgi:hypothetical protein